MLFAQMPTFGKEDRLVLFSKNEMEMSYNLLIQLKMLPE